MPACSSSPIDPVIDQLADLGEPPEVERPALLAALRSIPDPRDPRGVRHQLGAVLSIAACAVITGARTFASIAEWALDAGTQVLAPLGIGRCVPCESTIRRTLQRLDADVLDKALGAWAQQRTGSANTGQYIAVDGKAIRGAIGDTGRCRHVMAAVTHDQAVVLGQVDVDVKTNEIPMFSKLLDTIDITGSVITADALHVQKAHAEYLHARHADYVLTVKGNQPSLLHQLTDLPWDGVPATTDRIERGHGRREKRTIKICSVATGIDFPHAEQAFQITRKTSSLTSRTWHTETVHGITSIREGRVQHSRISTAVRDHWTIENKIHWVRDVTYDEDRSQTRTGNGPRVMASLRNLAISALRLAGHQNIAQATRHYNRRSHRPVTLLLTS